MSLTETRPGVARSNDGHSVVTINANNRVLNNVRLDGNVILSSFVNLYECAIGQRTMIGAFVEIQKNATIGSFCKISSHSFICEGVTIKDKVFVGHGVRFCNDKYPRACTPEGKPKTDADWECLKTFVDEWASIGSSVTILGGVKIGRGAIIGAGSVVTKDVEECAIYYGNPAFRAGFCHVLTGAKHGRMESGR